MNTTHKPVACDLTVIAWNRIIPDKLAETELVKKIPAFQGIRKFISMITTTGQQTLM
jgi:hypothetical protein